VDGERVENLNANSVCVLNRKFFWWAGLVIKFGLKMCEIKLCGLFAFQSNIILYLMLKT